MKCILRPLDARGPLNHRVLVSVHIICPNPGGISSISLHLFCLLRFMAPKIEMKSSKLFKSFKSGDAIRSLSLRSSGNSCSQNTGPSNESTDFPQDAIMSAADIAKLVADGFRSGEDSGDDAFDAQSDGRASSNLEDDSDDDNDDGSDETSTVKDLDDSVGSKTHVLDSNMLLAKLGPSPTAEQIASLAATKAQEYIVECFGDESTILSKEQFDAIPRYVKSDLLIGQFLGKGSFSDAFEVTLNVNTKREPKRINTDGAGTDSDQNLDAILAAAAGQFSGVGGGASAHSLPSHERNFSVNAGGRRRARRASATNLSQSVCMGSMKNATWGGTTQMTLAMKCLRPQIRSNAEQFLVGVEDLIHETAILASLNHPNIIKIHGRSGGSVSDSFRLSDGYFILLDRLTDTLEDRIQRWKKAPRASKKSPSVNQLKVASSLAGAMLFLHQNHICFRDLKPVSDLPA